MSHTALTFDTLQYAKRLKKVGFTEEQAEVQAEGLRELIEDKLATKHDIKTLRHEVRHEMQALEHKLTLKLGGLVVTCTAVLGGFLATIKFLA